MPYTIVDPLSGKAVTVGDDSRLAVDAKSGAIQHHVSHEQGEAYQIWATASLGAGTTVLMHISNESANKDMIITYLRHQTVGASGGTAFPSATNYFSVRLGREYVSGGTIDKPVNVNAGSGNEADVVAFENDPLLSGTAKEIDRWYTKADGDMNTFNKEGALIIPPNKTIEIAYVGDKTAGIIYARISFIMEDKL